MNHFFSAHLMDCKVSEKDRREAEAIFCQRIERELNGAAQVAAAYRGYEAVLAKYEELPLPADARAEEREAAELWLNAESEASSAAFEGWHGMKSGTMGGAYFEVTVPA